MNPEPDQKLFDRIRQGDVKAFETLFRAYYSILCHYATRYLKDTTEAEEIVQRLFVRLWENRKNLKIDSSVRNYLFRAVKNQCLNHLRHLQIKDEYLKAATSENDTDIDEQVEEQAEMLRLVEKAIASMPEKRQEIFRLSRQEGLKYKEIAQCLSISVKTVETQISLALKTLRHSLKNHLSFFL